MKKGEKEREMEDDGSQSVDTISIIKTGYNFNNRIGPRISSSLASHSGSLAVSLHFDYATG